MSKQLFFAPYTGSLEDKERQWLLTTPGIVPSASSQDMWIPMLAYVHTFYSIPPLVGSLPDHQRAFLLELLEVPDTGQTIDDLWGLVVTPWAIPT